MNEFPEKIPNTINDPRLQPEQKTKRANQTYKYGKKNPDKIHPSNQNPRTMTQSEVKILPKGESIKREVTVTQEKRIATNQHNNQEKTKEKSAVKGKGAKRR